MVAGGATPGGRLVYEGGERPTLAHPIFQKLCRAVGFALCPTLFLPATTSGRRAAFPTNVARIHEGREALTEASGGCIGEFARQDDTVSREMRQSRSTILGIRRQKI